MVRVLPQGRWPMQILTFDDWHLKEYGTTFEEKWMQPSMRVDIGLKAFTREIRRYVAYAIVQIVEESRGKP